MNKSDLCDFQVKHCTSTKLPAVAEIFLKQVEDRVRKVKEKQLSDEDLLTLHSVFGGVLQRALDILEKYPTLTVYVTANKLRSLIEIKGQNDRCYRVFPKINFCPCPAFNHQVLERKSQSAVFCALSEGVKFTVEEGKCVQASAYIPSDNFTEYHVRKGVDVMFKISIAVLSECLNIFGSGEESSIKMYYRGEGSPLLLVLQPQSIHNVMTDCEICTQTPDSVLEFRDANSEEVAKLVLKAPAFLGLLADIERSCDILELILSPEHPNFSMITYGYQDKSCIDMPKTSDMVQSFSCTEEVTLKYQLSHIRLIMKALAISTKVVLKCSSNGLLLLQLKLEKEDSRHMYSEFHIVPLLDD